MSARHFKQNAYAAELDAGGAVVWAATTAPTYSGAIYTNNLVDAVTVGKVHVAVGTRLWDYGKYHRYATLHVYGSSGLRLREHHLVSPGDDAKDGTRGFYAVAAVGNDAVVAGGWSKHKGGGNGAWLMGYELSSGKILWHHRDKTHLASFVDIEATPNSILGDGVAVDSGGTLRWFDVNTGKMSAPLSLTIGGKPAAIRGITRWANGDLAVASYGALGGQTATSLVVHRINAQKKVSVLTTLPLANKAFFNDMQLLSGGRLALVGGVEKSGLSTQGLLAIFEPLSAKWQETTVGDAGPESLSSLAVLDDGSLVAGGRRGTGKVELYVARFSPWGHNKCVVAGTCADIDSESCVDKNPCTLDSCDPAKGCINTAVKDGLACGAAKTCKAGACQ